MYVETSHFEAMTQSSPAAGRGVKGVGAPLEGSLLNTSLKLDQNESLKVKVINRITEVSQKTNEGSGVPYLSGRESWDPKRS